MRIPIWGFLCFYIGFSASQVAPSDEASYPDGTYTDQYASSGPINIPDNYDDPKTLETDQHLKNKPHDVGNNDESNTMTVNPDDDPNRRKGLYKLEDNVVGGNKNYRVVMKQTYKIREPIRYNVSRVVKTKVTRSRPVIHKISRTRYGYSDPGVKGSKTYYTSGNYNVDGLLYADPKSVQVESNVKTENYDVHSDKTTLNDHPDVVVNEMTLKELTPQNQQNYNAVELLRQNNGVLRNSQSYINNNHKGYDQILNKKSSPEFLNANKYAHNIKSGLRLSGKKYPESYHSEWTVLRDSVPRLNENVLSVGSYGQSPELASESSIYTMKYGGEQSANTEVNNVKDGKPHGFGQLDVISPISSANSDDNTKAEVDLNLPEEINVEKITSSENLDLPSGTGSDYDHNLRTKNNFIDENIPIVSKETEKGDGIQTFNEHRSMEPEVLDWIEKFTDWTLNRDTHIDELPNVGRQNAEKANEDRKLLMDHSGENLDGFDDLSSVQPLSKVHEILSGRGKIYGRNENSNLSFEKVSKVENSPGNKIVEANPVVKWKLRHKIDTDSAETFSETDEDETDYISGILHESPNIASHRVTEIHSGPVRVAEETNKNPKGLRSGLFTTLDTSVESLTLQKEHEHTINSDYDGPLNIVDYSPGSEQRSNVYYGYGTILDNSEEANKYNERPNLTSPKVHEVDSGYGKIVDKTNPILAPQNEMNDMDESLYEINGNTNEILQKMSDFYSATEKTSGNEEKLLTISDAPNDVVNNMNESQSVNVEEKSIQTDEDKNLDVVDEVSKKSIVNESQENDLRIPFEQADAGNSQETEEMSGQELQNLNIQTDLNKNLREGHNDNVPELSVETEAQIDKNSELEPKSNSSASDWTYKLDDDETEEVSAEAARVKPLDDDNDPSSSSRVRYPPPDSQGSIEMFPIEYYGYGVDANDGLNYPEPQPDDYQEINFKVNPYHFEYGNNANEGFNYPQLSPLRTQKVDYTSVNLPLQYDRVRNKVKYNLNHVVDENPDELTQICRLARTNLHRLRNIVAKNYGLNTKTAEESDLITIIYIMGTLNEARKVDMPVENIVDDLYVNLRRLGELRKMLCKDIDEKDQTVDLNFEENVENIEGINFDANILTLFDQYLLGKKHKIIGHNVNPVYVPKRVKISNQNVHTIKPHTIKFTKQDLYITTPDVAETVNPNLYVSVNQNDPVENRDQNVYVTEPDYEEKSHEDLYTITPDYTDNVVHKLHSVTPNYLDNEKRDLYTGYVDRITPDYTDNVVHTLHSVTPNYLDNEKRDVYTGYVDRDSDITYSLPSYYSHEIYRTSGTTNDENATPVYVENSDRDAYDTEPEYEDAEILFSFVPKYVENIKHKSPEYVNNFNDALFTTPPDYMDDADTYTISPNMYRDQSMYVDTTDPVYEERTDELSFTPKPDYIDKLDRYFSPDFVDNLKENVYTDSPDTGKTKEYEIDENTYPFEPVYVKNTDRNVYTAEPDYTDIVSRELNPIKPNYLKSAQHNNYPYVQDKKLSNKPALHSVHHHVPDSTIEFIDEELFATKQHLYPLILDEIGRTNEKYIKGPDLNLSNEKLYTPPDNEYTDDVYPNPIVTGYVENENLYTSPPDYTDDTDQTLHLSKQNISPLRTDNVKKTSPKNSDLENNQNAYPLGSDNVENKDENLDTITSKLIKKTNKHLYSFYPSNVDEVERTNEEYTVEPDLENVTEKLYTQPDTDYIEIDQNAYKVYPENVGNTDLNLNPIATGIVENNNENLYTSPPDYTEDIDQEVYTAKQYISPLKTDVEETYQNIYPKTSDLENNLNVYPLRSENFENHEQIMYTVEPKFYEPYIDQLDYTDAQPIGKFNSVAEIKSPARQGNVESISNLYPTESDLIKSIYHTYYNKPSYVQDYQNSLAPEYIKNINEEFYSYKPEYAGLDNYYKTSPVTAEETIQNSNPPGYVGDTNGDLYQPDYTDYMSVYLYKKPQHFYSVDQYHARPDIVEHTDLYKIEPDRNEHYRDQPDTDNIHENIYHDDQYNYPVRSDDLGRPNQDLYKIADYLDNMGEISNEAIYLDDEHHNVYPLRSVHQNTYQYYPMRAVVRDKNGDVESENPNIQEVNPTKEVKLSNYLSPTIEVVSTTEKSVDLLDIISTTPYIIKDPNDNDENKPVDETSEILIYNVNPTPEPTTENPKPQVPRDPDEEYRLLLEELKQYDFVNYPGKPKVEHTINIWDIIKKPETKPDYWNSDDWLKYNFDSALKNPGHFNVYLNYKKLNLPGDLNQKAVNGQDITINGYLQKVDIESLLNIVHYQATSYDSELVPSKELSLLLEVRDKIDISIVTNVIWNEILRLRMLGASEEKINQFVHKIVTTVVPIAFRETQKCHTKLLRYLLSSIKQLQYSGI